MRIGIASAQIGRLANPAAVRATALAAEAVGYSTVWVLDRLPAPLEPRSGYGGMDGVPMPPELEVALDPFAVLATAAAVTSRVRIGTSVLVAPWYPPAVLARSLTSLDVLSEGRLTVGLGTGWSIDEYEAVNVDIGARGRDLDEALDVLDAHWSDGPVAYHGRRARIAPSHNRLRPLQHPRPPLLLAAYTPAALDRVARRADGWMPAGFEIDAIGPVWAQIRDLAAGYGRDPDRMELVVRANIRLTDRPLTERPSYWGSLEQVSADVAATRDAGADEILLHVGGQASLDESLDACARITEQVGAAAAPALR
jgi:probable F420-dependent oxidoreductase